MFLLLKNRRVAAAALAIVCLLRQGYVKASEHNNLNDDFHFVEMKSADGVLLSHADKQFVYGEVASRVSFCENDSDFFCFDARMVEFYVPKKLGRRREWMHGHRVYCVVQSFREGDDKKGESASPGSRLSIIFSRPNGTCAQGANFDLKAMYSSETGLRALLVNNGNVSMELLSTDEFGFGAQEQ